MGRASPEPEPMPEPLAYLNGRFLPASQLTLPAHDAGFVFGATATDLVRTFRHRPFRLADHLARFRRSCEVCRIPQPVPDDELVSLAEELIAPNGQLLSPPSPLCGGGGV